MSELVSRNLSSIAGRAFCVLWNRQGEGKQMPRKVDDKGKHTMNNRENDTETGDR